MIYLSMTLFCNNKNRWFKEQILALVTLKSLRNMYDFFILTICDSYNVLSFSEITVGQDRISLFKFSHHFSPQKSGQWLEYYEAYFCYSSHIIFANIQYSLKRFTKISDGCFKMHMKHKQQYIILFHFIK